MEAGGWALKKGKLKGLGLALAASPVFSDEAAITIRLCTDPSSVDHTSWLAMFALRYDMKVAKRRLRNKLRKLIGRRRAIARRLKEIDDALAELGQLGK